MLQNLHSIKNDIKYIMSIGRRQPMHIGHKKALEKILALKEVELIYVIGSANEYGDELFDPYKNPLNIKHQIEQFKRLFPNNKAIFMPISDCKDMNSWCLSIIENLKKLKINKKNVAVHFIGKKEDKIQNQLEFLLNNEKEVILRKGQWEIEALSYYDLAIWFDNDSEVNLEISAKKLRLLDLQNIPKEEQQIFACYDYIKELCLEARKVNCINHQVPLTLNDLSIIRAENKINLLDKAESIQDIEIFC